MTFKRKILIFWFLLIYSISLIFNNYIFLIWSSPVEASEEQEKSINLVAIFVDNNIYQNIKQDIEWYSKNYVQQKIDNSQALVFPINTDNFKAKDITKILDNLYFEWNKKYASKLIWTLLIWDIPLPVVNKEWYYFPSVYPYIDFIDRKYVYDQNTNFFEYVWNDSTQPEIWHSIIKFEDIENYTYFFTKLKNYKNNPSNFVSKKIWYEDLIALKKYFYSGDMDWYLNKMIFSEDLWYNRLSWLLLQLMMADSMDDLQSTSSAIEDNINNTDYSWDREIVDDEDYQDQLDAALAKLKETIELINSFLSLFGWNFSWWNGWPELPEWMEDFSIPDFGSIVPTKLLSTSIQNFLKWYNSLFSQQYISNMIDNINVSWRRYYADSGSGVMNDNVDNSIEKIMLKDEMIQTFLISQNNLLEKAINEKLIQENYSMDVSIIQEYVYTKYNNKTKTILWVPKKYCEVVNDDYYTNYYFWLSWYDIANIVDTSIYRWTFTNYDNLSWINVGQLSNNGIAYVNDPVLMSNGWTCWIFSNQTQSNRWFNVDSLTSESELYEQEKIPQKRKIECDNHFKILWIKIFCMSKTRLIDEEDPKETPTQFAIRNWWWASSLNLNMESFMQNIYEFQTYNYKNAWKTIYDLAWTVNLLTWEDNANSYLSAYDYGSLIRVNDRYWKVEYPNYIGWEEQDWNKITLNANDYKYLDVYKDESNRWWWNKKNKIIKVNWTEKKWSGGGMWWKCWSKYEEERIFDYKLLDSIVINNSPTMEQLSWMTMLTPNRPIDSPRYVTFQWLAWESIKLIYPNFYHVEVYNQEAWNKLTLKTIDEIEDSIRFYLKSIVTKYNQDLQDQLDKKWNYYNDNKEAFDFVWSIKSTATPNRTYSLIDEDFLIDSLYSSEENISSDDIIKILAETLYYQNLWWKQKSYDENILENISLQKQEFNLNNKIKYILDNYISEKEYISHVEKKWYPLFNLTGYEIWYINSDSMDMIYNEFVPSDLSNFTKLKPKNSDNSNSSTERKIENEKPECSKAFRWAIPILEWPGYLVDCWFEYELSKFKAELRRSWMDYVGWWFWDSFVNQFSSIINEWSSQIKSDFSDYKDEVDEFIFKKDSEYDPNIDIKLVPNNTVANLDDLDEQKLTIDLISNDENISDLALNVSLSWDICISLDWDNLCTSNKQYDLDNWFGKFFIEPIDYKKWNFMLNFEICRNDNCIDRSIIYNFIPWKINDVKLETLGWWLLTSDSKLLKWWQIPIKITAYDQFGNNISSTIDAYNLSLENGRIKYWDSFSTWFSFSSFDEAVFVYDSQGIENDTIRFHGESAFWEEIYDEEFDLNLVDWEFDLLPEEPSLIEYTLPDPDSNEYIYDEDWNLITGSLFHYTIDLYSLDWFPLESFVNITTENNTFDIMLAESDYIYDWKLDFYLIPTFRSWEDNLIIEIPWLEPKVIPIVVKSATPKVVNLFLNKAKIDQNEEVELNLEIKDIWWNIVSDKSPELTLDIIWDSLEFEWTTGTNISVLAEWWLFNTNLISKSPWWKNHIIAKHSNNGIDYWDSKTLEVKRQIIDPQNWNINIMYLNLFGSDWGNMWWYFSPNDNIAIDLLNKSAKNLATTTQLIDPENIKKSIFLIWTDLSIQNTSKLPAIVEIEDGDIYLNMLNVWNVSLWNINHYINIDKIDNTNQIEKNKNGIYLLSEKDIFINWTNIVYSWENILDLSDNTWNYNETNIILSENNINGFSNFEIFYQWEYLWKLFIYRRDNYIISNPNNLNIKDSFGVINWFWEGSTNWKKWVYIYNYDESLSSTSNWYESIQDSLDVDLSIWFQAKYQNITNFANWLNVWDSTKNFSSEYLINFGDPLLTRVSDNDLVENTNFDSWVWQKIYSTSDQMIKKVINLDFNNDWLEDILVIYVDDSIRILKNYWWNDPFSDLWELMVIADWVKEVYNWDVDWNWYEDLIITTKSNKIRSYLNNNWIFDVNGNVVCLDVPFGPENIKWIYQLFFRDRNDDNKLDIVTNDMNGDIKIFYWWSTDSWANYISNDTYTCDDNRLDRQEWNMDLIDSYWLSVTNQQVFDNSLVHREGLIAPSIEYDVNMISDSLEFDWIQWLDYEDPDYISKVAEFNQWLAGDVMNKALWSNETLINSQKYQTLPTQDYLPSYSNLTWDYIDYSKFSFANTNEDKIYGYKKYTDLNWGRLILWDKVRIDVHLIWNWNTKWTYLEYIEWPWNIYKDENNLLTWFHSWTLPSDVDIFLEWKWEYLFMIDNIHIQNSDEYIFSYIIEYAWAELVKLYEKQESVWNYSLLNYSTDTCIKNYCKYFNNWTWQKNCEEIDISFENDDFMENLGDTIDNILSTETLDDVWNMVLNSISTNNEIWINIPTLSIWWETLNDASKVLDNALEWACKWFSVWWDSTVWLPLPHSIAFLAPWMFNVMWCPVFPDMWLPIFSVPTLWPINIWWFPIPPFWPINFVWAWWWFGWGPSLFRIYLSPTTTWYLWITLCWWYYEAWMAFPNPPFWSIIGNCIVFVVPMTSLWWNSGNWNWTDFGIAEDMINSLRNWSCENDNYWTDKLVTPFNFVSYWWVANLGWWSSWNPNSAMSINISRPVTPMSTSGWWFSLFAWEEADLKWGESLKNSVKDAMSSWIVSCLMKKFVDNQIWYIANNLTSMWVYISLPDITEFGDDIYIPNDEDKETLKESFNEIYGDSEKANPLVRDLLLPDENNYEMQELFANPFEQFATHFEKSPLISMSTRNVSLQIPTMSEKELTKQITYLSGWWARNTEIINDWTSIVMDLSSLWPEWWMCNNLNRCDARSDNFDDNSSRKIRALDNCNAYASGWMTSESCEEAISYYSEFALNLWSLKKSVKKNIINIRKWSKYPTQLYDYIHLVDKYIADVVALVESVMSWLTGWLKENGVRFDNFVDALIAIIWQIESWQALISFSVDWNVSCSKCSKDSYDLHSCVLWLLCVDIPVLPIPPFRIPDIYIDLTKIDIKVDVVLPIFSFQPVRIPTIKIPDFPAPPNILLFGDLDVPGVPVIPPPPTLPNIPTLVPTLILDLPTMIPPAPKIPDIMPTVDLAVEFAKLFGKIYCIIKNWVWLVWESMTKTRIEQLTQRTYPVFPFDYLSVSLPRPPLVGSDYKLSTDIQLWINLDALYNVVDTLWEISNWAVDSLIKDNIKQGFDEFGNWMNKLRDKIDSYDNMNMNLEVYNKIYKWYEYPAVEYDLLYNKLLNNLNYAYENIDSSKSKKHISKLLNILKKDTWFDVNIEWINKIKQLFNSDIDSYRQYNILLSDTLKTDYDKFLKEYVNDISLVNQNSKYDKTYYTNLFSADDEIVDLIKKQDTPLESYIKINKDFIDWLYEEIDNNPPSKFDMNINKYNTTKEYLKTIKQKTEKVLPMFENWIKSNNISYNNKNPFKSSELKSDLPIFDIKKSDIDLKEKPEETLSNGFWNNDFDIDVTQFLKWYYIEWTDNKYYNVISWKDKWTQIFKDWNSIKYDINKDSKDDIILWDDINIYIKYWSQNNDYESDNLENYSYYYEFSSNDFQTINDLENSIDSMWYYNLDWDEYKIWDIDYSVNGLKKVGQNFDNISISWDKNQNVEWYIIEFTNRVDVFNDKEILLDDPWFSNILEKKYVLVIPEGFDIAKSRLYVDRDDNLQWWFIYDYIYMEDSPIYDIYTMDISEDVLGYTFYNLEQEWQYIKVSPLTNKKDLSDLNMNNSNNNIYTLSSPWSNQITAWTQIWADQEWPSLDLKLIRSKTWEIKAEGYNLDGYINTDYMLVWQWTDNWKVMSNWINYDDNKILEAEWWDVNLSNVYYKDETTEYYEFVAIDQAWNISKQKVQLNISIPSIDVSNIDVSNGYGTITAVLSEEIDDGKVWFEIMRWNKSTILTWFEQWMDKSLYEVSFDDYYVTWSIFEIDNNMLLIADNWDEIWEINIDTSEVIISPDYINKIDLEIDFSKSVPMLLIKDKIENKILFNIYLVPNGLYQVDPIIIKNWNYSLLELDSSFVWQFENGYCIQKDLSECIFYISKDGYVYVPDYRNTELNWKYEYLSDVWVVQYNVYDSTNAELFDMRFLSESFRR